MPDDTRVAQISSELNKLEAILESLSAIAEGSDDIALRKAVGNLLSSAAAIIDYEIIPLINREPTL